MTLEELVRDSIADHTTGPVPPPDLAAITRRRRSRSHLVPLVTAAAAVTVIIAGIFLTPKVSHTDAPPVPATSAPSSTPTAVRTLLRPQGDLHISLVGSDKVSIGGALHALALPGGEALTAATPYGLVSIGDDLRPVLVRPDGTEVSLGGRVSDSTWRPTLVADPDGNLVAWTSMENSRLTGHVYDLGQLRETALLNNAATLIGMDSGMVVEEVPDGGGSSYRVWDASGYGGFERLLSAGRVAVVGVAGRTIFYVGPGSLAISDVSGGALTGWRTHRLSDSLQNRSPSDWVIAPDGRTRLISGPSVGESGPAPEAVVAIDVASGARTELFLSPNRVGNPRLGHDTDGTPMVLTRIAGGDGWALYDCPMPGGDLRGASCWLRESGLQDASFPGDTGYQAPWPASEGDG
ncbi:hypothetical protein [Mumia sp. DW29H23]|uniref:hypothetical protein n=1 Tax=Mumia sp. DW29H23 TaxID=3421241 RepID=UPI003D69BB50